MKYQDVVKFLFEMGSANEVKNVGWQLLKIDNPTTLSQHSFRSAIISFIIASNEEIENPYRIALFSLIHKIHKTRLGDRHKVSASYNDYPPQTREDILTDQLSLLGHKTRKLMDTSQLTEVEKFIIQDASQLQMALEAKEYMAKGYKKAEVWISRIGQVLKTKTSKKLFEKLKKTDPHNWWEDLKRAPRVDKVDYIAKT